MSVGSGPSAVPTYVVSASYDKQIRLWDAATGRTVRTFAFQDSQVNQIQMVPVTSHLAVTGFGVIRLYDTASLLSSGTGAEAASAGPNSANAAPPLVASFESQSTMNFTSVGGVPLLPVKRHESEETGDVSLGGGAGPLNESTSFLGATCVLNEFGMSTMPPTYSTEDPRGPYAPGVALYATSEDGHLRFFDGRSIGTLHVVKDIATGASITCSALSPDHRFLLTGNQMGIVSVWHVPTVIASASDDYRQRGRASTSASAATAAAAAAMAKKPSAASGADAENTTEVHADPEGAASTTAPTIADTDADEKPRGTSRQRKAVKLSYEAQPGVFSGQPLQEIAFDKDYSAIRSIACDPTGHWFVVATNAGKLHFLRFAQDTLMGGSRTRRARHGHHGAHRSGEKNSAETGDSLHTDGDERHSLSSRLDFGGAAGSSKSSEAAVAAARGRESIYRSALVVNELSSNARRRTSSAGGGSSPGGKDSSFAAPTALLPHEGSMMGSAGGNTMGAVLLNSLEQQHRSLNSVAAAAAAAASMAGDGTGLGQLGSPLTLITTEARTPLQEETELEVFHSVQAHYKYILRVAISPNAKLIVTCSADYTVGRYAVPTFMQPEALTRHLTMGDAGSEPAGRIVDNSSVVAGLASTTSTQAPPGDGQATTATASVASVNVPADRPSEPTSVSPDAPLDKAGGDDGREDGDATTTTAATTTTTAGGPLSAAASVERQETAVGPNSRPSSTVPARDDAEYRGGSLNSTAGGHDEDDDADEDAGSRGQSFCEPGAAADAVQLTAMKPLMGHNRWVWDCAFSECSHYLFTASSDNHLRMWNGLTTDRPQSTTFVGHTKPVISVLLFAEQRIAPNA